MNMKFTIRDLLLVTVIVAVLAAWMIDHRQRAKEIQELKEQLEQGKKALMTGGFF